MNNFLRLYFFASGLSLPCDKGGNRLFQGLRVVSMCNKAEQTVNFPNPANNGLKMPVATLLDTHFFTVCGQNPHARTFHNRSNTR